MTWCLVDFVVSADYWMKTKESDNLEKYVDLAWEPKIVEYESDDDSICIWYDGNVPWRLTERFRELDTRRRIKNYADKNILKLCWNI